MRLLLDSITGLITEEASGDVVGLYEAPARWVHLPQVAAPVFVGDIMAAARLAATVLNTPSLNNFDRQFTRPHFAALH